MEVEYTAENIFKVFRVSWTSYVSSFVLFVVHIAILYGIYYLLTHTVHRWINFSPNVLNIIAYAAIALAAVRLIFFVINILSLKSVALYTNSDGVWVYSGIFPWSKGSSGVKWRDMDSATYKTGFLSWLLKTYDVRIEHRFTKENEIALYSIFNGHKAVMHINEMHKKFIAGGVLE
ncbi:MAG: hypothetical protein LBF71_02075 [Campylobacteraceae bacterium]|jgi:hypothetical protein|nr:hypothetical protein [Campylobacteraceae bacterium]